MVWINSNYCVLGRSVVAKANDIIKFEPDQYLNEENVKMREKRQLPDVEGLERNSRIQVVEKDRVFLIATKKIDPGE